MNRPNKLIHRLSNVLFVPTVMLILAGVVKCSQLPDHGGHKPLALTAHNTSGLQAVQAGTNGNNELPETMNR